jgi:hypothetical protein
MGLESQRLIFNSYGLKIFYGGYQKHLYGERKRGLAVKDVFLIPMVAIGITGKEHGQWGLPVKM